MFVIDSEKTTLSSSHPTTENKQTNNKSNQKPRVIGSHRPKKFLLDFIEPSLSTTAALPTPTTKLDLLQNLSGKVAMQLLHLLQLPSIP